MTKLQSITEDFIQALTRLEEVLREQENEFVRDAAIKRFEIVFELAWKTMKAYTEEVHSGTCVSPRSCFQEAFRVGLLEYDDAWLRLITTRSYTAHTYEQALAEEVYRSLPQAVVLFTALKATLTKEAHT